MDQMTISPEERTLAAITHLSGLSGYIIPFGGVLVPIIIWIVKSESRVISSIAKQAVLLNLVVFLLAIVGIILLFTVILIPVVFVLAVVVGVGAIVLPIVGALKANQGIYYRYPVVGIAPADGSAAASHV
jgi:uncharacterized protein